MKHKMLKAVLCAVMILSLPGCRLAREDFVTETYEDRLVGVFVTTEFIDLFDFEQFFGNNRGRFDGGGIVTDGQSQQYQGRIYAALVDRTLTSDTGETTEIKEYVFDGIEGIPFFSFHVANDHENYRSSVSDEAISNGAFHISHGDDESSTVLEGTIFAVSANPKTFYLNPVYQNADGSVYLMSGGGISGSGVHSEGPMMSQTLETVYTVTENGMTKTDSVSVTISVSFMFAPEAIAVLQMDQEARLITRNEYTPGALPEEIATEPGTAFLIVETKKQDHEGNPVISREIYGSDAESIETFHARPDNICVKTWTPVSWR